MRNTRCEALVLDPLNFPGATRIHNPVSMSNRKCDIVVEAGIDVVRHVEIPRDLVPNNVRAKMTAKVWRPIQELTSASSRGHLT